MKILKNYQKIVETNFYVLLKLEINIFKYQALKKHMGSYIELPKSLQRQGLINIKNTDNYCFIWSYIRYINPLNKTQIELLQKKKVI